MKFQKALRALVAFLSAMLALTILARAADSIMLPIVTTARVLPGTLKYTIDMDGILASPNEVPVMGEADVPVGALSVRKGQSVAAGEALFTYDVSTLNALLNSHKSKLNKLKLEAQLKALDNAPTDDKATDATTRQREDIERQLLGIELQDEQLIVDRLSAISAAGGVINAPVAGVVTDIVAQPGDTVSGAVMRIAAGNAALVLRATIDHASAKHLRVGNEARFMLAGKSRYESGAVISALAVSEDGIEVSVLLPGGVGTPGQTASVRVTRETDSHSQLVPLDALTEQNSIPGVLVLRTQETVLGEQEIVEFVPATVAERDLQNAAVTGSLMSTDRVIATTTKPVKPGDRVRSRT